MELHLAVGMKVPPSMHAPNRITVSVVLLVAQALSLCPASPTQTAASREIDRLATMMQWKSGFVVADIGAGDGRYSFAAAQHVGPAGKVFATEIDQHHS
jgi:predicted RNA methylase